MSDTLTVGLVTAAFGAVVGILEFWRSRRRDGSDAGNALLDDYQVALAAERELTGSERKGRLAAERRAMRAEREYLDVHGQLAALQLECERMRRHITALEAEVAALKGDAP